MPFDPKHLRKVMSGKASWSDGAHPPARVDPPSAPATNSPSNCRPDSARGFSPLDGDAPPPAPQSASRLSQTSRSQVSDFDDQNRLKMSARQLRGVGIPAGRETPPASRRGTDSPEPQIPRQEEPSSVANLRAQLRGKNKSSISSGATASTPTDSNLDPPHAPQHTPSVAPLNVQALRSTTGRPASPNLSNAPPFRSARTAFHTSHAARPSTPDSYSAPRPASACSNTSTPVAGACTVSPRQADTPKLKPLSHVPTVSSPSIKPSSIAQFRSVAAKTPAPVSSAPVKACSPWDAGDSVHAIRAARKKLGKEAFLEYIYANHPPKEEQKKLNPKLDIKKQMQKALSHYHPDKQNLLEHGPEWCLICEEVCKEITRMYNKRPIPSS